MLTILNLNFSTWYNIMLTIDSVIELKFSIYDVY